MRTSSRASSGSSSPCSRLSACRSSGYFKWKTSRRLGSKGLAAEAKESIACSIDSALTMIAMIAGLLAAPHWVDPALSLLMVPWFLREGLAHVRGRVHAHEH